MAKWKRPKTFGGNVQKNVWWKRQRNVLETFRNRKNGNVKKRSQRFQVQLRRLSICDLSFSVFDLRFAIFVLLGIASSPFAAWNSCKSFWSLVKSIGAVASGVDGYLTKMAETNAASLPENAVGGCVRNLARRCAHEYSSDDLAVVVLLGIASSPFAAWNSCKSMWSLIKLPATGVGNAVCASASVSKVGDVRGSAAPSAAYYIRYV